MEFAVIQTGGKQYVVKPGDVLKVEKLSGYTDDTRPQKGAEITFNEVLLVDDGDSSTTVGDPFIRGAKVTATLVSEGKERTVTIIKYKSKTRQKRRAGHRQRFSTVKIESIK
ncbi:MAG: 50S ribosomal protein L21 [Candidatus Vogelbacteria bacterium]|nr:50S ribosomal protein L21 [Candidatus Vogelbacteria bacterium]